MEQPLITYNFDGRTKVNEDSPFSPIRTWRLSHKI